jgi:imidazolonepropionase
VLGLADRGSIEVGKRADLVILDAPVEHIAYRFGHNPVRSMIVGGEFVG